jgi:hypothetical protein
MCKLIFYRWKVDMDQEGNPQLTKLQVTPGAYVMKLFTAVIYGFS